MGLVVDEPVGKEAVQGAELAVPVPVRKEAVLGEFVLGQTTVVLERAVEDALGEHVRDLVEEELVAEVLGPSCAAARGNGDLLGDVDLLDATAVLLGLVVVGTLLGLVVEGTCSCG